MLTIAYCFVLKIANIYLMAAWAFIAVSSELLENEIGGGKRKNDLSNQLASFVVIKPQRKKCLRVSK